MDSKADKKFYYTISNLLDVATRAYKIFEFSKPEKKRKLLNLMFSNLKLEGEKLAFDLKRPFDLMVSMSKTQNLLRRQDSDLQP